VIVGSEDLPLNGSKQREKRSGGRYPRVEVWFGEPFELQPRSEDGKRYSMAELTDAMMIELARLLPEHMRGIYSGAKSEQPHSAISRKALVFPGGH
jgi:hypothetical protein